MKSMREVFQLHLFQFLSSNGEVVSRRDGIITDAHLVLPLTMHHLLFLLFLPFPLLVGRPEDQIHHEDLIGDDDGDQQYGLVLLLLMQFRNEEQEELAIGHDLGEKDSQVSP